MTKIYRAYYDSKSFTFEAFGNTEHEAIDSLVIGLIQHTTQYKLSPDWWQFEGIETDTYEIGLPYRDRELIKSNKGVK
jgi:hypothetical protein